MKRNPDSSSSAASRSSLVIVALLTLLPFLAGAVDFPAWWQQRGALTVNPATQQPVAADDFAALNQGQLKNLAVAAYDELNARLTVPFGGVTGAGPQVEVLIKGWYQTTGGGAFLLDGSGHRLPKVTPATDDYAAVNLGQLKTVAQPFYTRLIAIGYCHAYPWEGSPTPADDYALANLGQAKNLFNFDLTTSANIDNDGDGLSNSAELQHGTNPQVADSDSDGVNDGDEVNTLGTNPLDSDTDHDGLMDGQERNYGSNPNNADSDGDTIPDGEEIANGTDPNSADSDGDGALDANDAFPSDVAHALPWQHYAVLEIQGEGDLSAGTVISLNNSGNAVLLADTYQRWQDGQLSALHRLENIGIVGIDNANVVRGTAAVVVEESGYVTVSLWPSGSSEPTFLKSLREGTPPYVFGASTDYNMATNKIAASSWPRAFSKGGTTVGTFRWKDWGYGVWVPGAGYRTGLGGAVFPISPGITFQLKHYEPHAGEPYAQDDVPDLTACNDFGVFYGEGAFSGSVSDTGLKWESATSDPVDVGNRLVRAVANNGVAIGSRLNYQGTYVWESNPDREIDLGGAWIHAINHGNQILGYIDTNRSATWRHNTQLNRYESQPLVGSGSVSPEWRIIDASDLNDLGVLSGSSARTVDALGNPIPETSQIPHAVLLLPVEMKLVDRDDPKKKWADAVDGSGKKLYAGETTGDMVSWKLGGTDSWTSMNFSWSAKGPNGQTIQGPSGTGKNEWKIANGDEDTANDWLKWKPGKWKIKVQIGSTAAEFEQQVGWRTESHLVIGQIIETHTHDGDSPPLIAVGNYPWEISSPVALFRRAVVYDIAAWFPSNGIRDALTIAPAPITAFPLTELWFFYWAELKSHNSTPQGPFVSSNPFGFGTVEYKHRYWMTQHMLNLGRDQPLAPPQIAATNLNQTQQAQQFRIMHRYQAKFTLDDAGKIKDKLPVGAHIKDKGITKIAVGIEANQLWDGSPALGPWQLFHTESETNVLNGKEPVSADGTKTSGFATGRIGEKGRNVNWRLFGKDAPWIFSEIVFEVEADRTVETTHRTSVDISWRNGSIVQGNKQFNNLNIYKAVQEEIDDGSFVITYQREDLLKMEGKLEPFINSASGQWPEPNIPPSVQ